MIAIYVGLVYCLGREEKRDGKQNGRDTYFLRKKESKNKIERRLLLRL